MAALTWRVTGIGGRVSVRVTATRTVRIKAGTDTGVTAGVVYSPAVTPDANGYAKCTLTGLTPGTRYYYRVAMTDTTSGAETLDTHATIGRIMVAPTGQANFTFDFASCCGSSTYSATQDSAAMTAIAARNDAFFLHLGDLWYDDAAAPSLANYRSHNEARFVVANHLRVFATMPCTFIPSDHDFSFANNGTGITDTTARTQYNQVYREMMPVSPVSTAGTTGVYHTFTWGRVRFIMLDGRSFQSNPATTVDSATKTMLGATQKQWLKDTITAATEKVIVICCDTAWTGAYDAALPNDDSWSGCPTERLEIANFLKTQTGKGFVYLGGDQHSLSANDGTGTGLGLPSFQASPLLQTASIKGGDWTSGPYPASGSAVTQAYGRVVVTDTGTNISLAFTGYTSDNVARVTQTNTFAVTGPTVAVSATRGTTWRARSIISGSRSSNWRVLAANATISVSVSTSTLWAVAAPAVPLTRVNTARLTTWTAFAAQDAIAVETWNGAAGAAWPAQWTIAQASTGTQPGAVTTGSATITGAQQGQITTGAAAFSVGPTAYLSGMPLSRDVEVTVDVAADTFLADSYTAINLRATSGALRSASDYVTANGYYLAVINEPVGGTGGAWEVGRVVGGIRTAFTRTPYTFSGRTRVRFQVVGASIAVRVWNAAAAEPAAWGYTGTDPAPFLADGRVLLTAQSGAAAAARSATYENLVVAPVTLTRVNAPRNTFWNSTGAEQAYTYGGYLTGYGPSTTPDVIRPVGTPTRYENSISTSATVPVPAGTVLGELLLTVISQASPSMIGTPIAWQMLAHAEVNGASIAMFARFATATEPASYIFPASSDAGPLTGIMSRIQGVTPAIIDAAATTAVTDPTTLGLFLPSVSTVSVNTLLVSAYAIGATSVQPVTPVEMSLVAASTGVGEATALASEFRQPVGASGARGWTMQPALNPYAQAGILLALRSTATATGSVTGLRNTFWQTRLRTTQTADSRWTVSASGGVTTVTAERRSLWSVGNVAVTSQVTAETARSTWNIRARAFAARLASWSTFSQTLVGAPVTTRPGIRLRVYAPNGADLGPLPTPQTVNTGYPLNDVGSLTFSYLSRAPRSDLLGKPCEIAVEVSPDSGVNWVEPPDSRFVYVSDGMDPRAAAPAYEIETRSYVWLLSKARVLPNGLLNADGKRAFLSATPGVILKTLFGEAQNRGAMAGFTHGSFSTAADSSGAPWANQLTIYYEPGLDYLAVLRDLADQGFIDFRMQGRSIEVYNGDTILARDRTIGAGQVVFLPGRDITEAPFRRTWEGLSSYAYFAGDNATYEFTNPAAVVPWGRAETFISNGSVSDPGTMATLTQAELALGEQERTEYTRGLDFTRAFSRPFWDYRVGDYVWTTVDGQSLQRFRIRQLTLTSNEQSIVSGNVVLNDRFLEADVRAKRRIEGITNGASSGTGTGTTPGDPTTEPGADKMPPAKVSGLVGSSAAYLSVGGFPQVQVTLTWQAVTVNNDGTPADDIDRYEVYQRPFNSDQFSRIMVATTTETTHSMSPYVTSSSWYFSVRAVDSNGNRGLLSGEVLVTMARDAIPPQAPSSPVVDDYLGTLMVTWDGNPATGQWPGDFSYVEVHTSTVNNFTPTSTTLANRLYGKGSVSIIDVTFGIPVYVKLIAVDTSDLRSPASAQAVGTPHRLVGSDLDPDAITYEQLSFKDPGNVIPDGSFESATYRATLAARSETAWTFTTANATHGDYSATINAGTGAGTVRRLNLMTVAEGQQILATDRLFTRYAFNATAGANGTAQLVVEWLMANGTTQRSVLPAVLRNGTWQQQAVQQQAPAGVENFRIYLEVDAAANLGTWYFDTVEVRRTVGTAIIQDAAISRAQIADLAVNSAKIFDLTVGKLTGGTLNASVLLGNQIVTSTSGARVELSPSGVRLFDAAGGTKVWLNPATGQLRTYSTSDVTHTSTAHGFQVGDDAKQNLAIDDNEIMSRLAGSYGELYLNREGGPILIGGKVGGFNPDFSDTGVFPADRNHHVVVRASMAIHNVSDGEFADEFPPLLIGRPGGLHLWLDSNEIGATAATGDAVGTLILHGNRNTGDPIHTESIKMASDSIAVRRWGVYSSGTRSCLIYGLDGNSTGLRFSGNQLRLYVTDGDASVLRPISATSFDVSSSRSVKHSVEPLPDALAMVRGAPSRRWKYRDTIEPVDRWHVGPMFEDLPDEVRIHSDGTGEVEYERTGAASLPSMIGLLWEAVRHLADKVEALEADKHADQR